jgi:hypothetical protein
MPSTSWAEEGSTVAQDRDFNDRARIALGVVRLVNGALGLLLPRVLIRRIDATDSGPAAVYAFRLFGIRNILIGRDVLARRGEALDRSLDEAVLVHGTDSLTAMVLTATGAVPRRAGLSLVTISGINTTLALLGRRTRHA